MAQEVRSKAGLRGFSRGFTSTLTRHLLTVLYCTVLYCTVLYCTAHPHLGGGQPGVCCREPVAFGCYFTSFELLTRDRKENNLWLFLGKAMISGYPVYR